MSMDNSKSHGFSHPKPEGSRNPRPQKVEGSQSRFASKKSETGPLPVPDLMHNVNADFVAPPRLTH